MKEVFVPRHFQYKTRETIADAVAIIEEYQNEGFNLTVRQLYYQFVTRELIPNKQAEYDRLGAIINNARLAGLIDWDAIEDRTRQVRSRTHWESPIDIIAGARRSFHKDLWEGQLWRLEVWIEKDALLGVIASICHRYDVPYFSCRGYVSQSEMYQAAKRFKEYELEGAIPVIIHLGDHDPSGIDMTRDIIERISLFTGIPIYEDADSDDAAIHRIALNMDQVESLNLPPNPAKEADSRYASYISKYGASSWELDALDPKYLERLLKETFDRFVDVDLKKQVEAEIRKGKAHLFKVEQNWDQVVQFVKDLD